MASKGNASAKPPPPKEVLEQARVARDLDAMPFKQPHDGRGRPSDIYGDPPMKATPVRHPAGRRPDRSEGSIRYQQTLKY